MFADRASQSDPRLAREYRQDRPALFGGHRYAHLARIHDTHHPPAVAMDLGRGAIEPRIRGSPFSAHALRTS